MLNAQCLMLSAVYRCEKFISKSENKIAVNVSGYKISDDGYNMGAVYWKNGKGIYLNEGTDSGIIN
jgi:hypothetical protein